MGNLTCPGGVLNYVQDLSEENKMRNAKRLSARYEADIEAARRVIFNAFPHSLSGYLPVVLACTSSSSTSDISRYSVGECICQPDRFWFIEHQDKSCCPIRKSLFFQIPYRVHRVKEPLCTGNDHGSRVNSHPVDS